MSRELPRVLFVASDSSDYQSDTLFHGLRLILGERLVETPRRDPLYTDFPERVAGQPVRPWLHALLGLARPDPDRPHRHPRAARGR